MLGKKGVTLIELLIVVTILSILAGAAIPYVQDYVEDARIGRAKADIDEIRNALARYEVERGATYNATGVASLVGPFLSRALTDPWGAPYVINGTTSQVLSKGPDGNVAGGDDVALDFRPRMAVSQIYWLDVSGDGSVGAGDSMLFKTTRPLIPTGNITSAGLTCSAGAIATIITGNATRVSNNRIASFAVTANAPFVPGKDTITMGASDLKDANSVAALVDTLTIKSQ